MDKNDKNYKNKRKVIDHCHYTGKFRGAAHNKCNINYKVPKDIPVIVHNTSYDTHFMINQLAEKFKDELDCIGENIEKYITFSVPIRKKCGDGKTVTHKLKFIDSFRFMPTSLSELVDNFSGKIFNSIECKKCMERERINWQCCFDQLKNGRLIHKCRECKEKWEKPIEGLIKKFSSIYQFCNGDLNKFVLLLRKGVYPYKDMDSWEKFSETSLPGTETFYSNLNLENISDDDYAHAQKVWKVFGIRNRGEYHDLYVQTDTLLPENVFEKFRNNCIDIYWLDPVYFVIALGLAWQVCLKKTEIRTINRL